MIDRSEPLLTLEPLIEAVQLGVEGAGWEMSGLQKTTSHQFEGKWEGESTRSAYLFFHHPARRDGAGIDVYLDETSRGLQGTLSLVLEGPTLGALGDTAAALARLGGAVGERLPPGLRAPVSVRVRLPHPAADPGSSDVEVRFKLRIPASALAAGSGAVASLAAVSVRAFEALLEHRAVRELLHLDPDG